MAPSLHPEDSSQHDRAHDSGSTERGTAVCLDENGLLAFHPTDKDNPKNWSKARRWYITVVATLLSLNATMASSAPSGALISIASTFHVSEEAAELNLTLFLLGYAFGPLFWAPLSEFFGRRWILCISFALYMAFLFLCAFPPNFGGLLVGRFLTSTFVSGVISTTPGILSDIWPFTERGEAMVLFAVVLFIGPAISPVLAGFFQLTETFRWTFYMLLWLGAASAVTLLAIPETYPPKILAQKAQRLRQSSTQGLENIQAPIEKHGKSLLSLLWVSLTRPWVIMFDPIALFINIYISIVYMLLYMLFTIYPIVFQEHRGWNSGVGELPLLGIIVGNIPVAIICLIDSRRTKKAILAGIKPRPEERLHIAMLAAILFPMSMFWFAWTANFNAVPWIVPTIAGAFLSMSICLVFVAYLNYLTDSYLIFAASANASNTVVRSACAAAAPLFDTYMFDKLGVGGAGSLIGGVACLLAPIPFVFYFYGERLRSKSRFAPTHELDPGDAESLSSNRSNEDANNEETSDSKSQLEGLEK